MLELLGAELAVEAGEDGRHLAQIVRDSADFLKVVAGTDLFPVLVEGLDDLSRTLDNAGGVIYHTTLDTLAKVAAVRIFEAPVCPVVVETLEVTGLVVLEEKIGDQHGGGLVVFNTDGERVGNDQRQMLL